MVLHLSRYRLEDIIRGIPGFDDELTVILKLLSQRLRRLRVASLYLPNATLSTPRNTPASYAG